MNSLLQHFASSNPGFSFRFCDRTFVQSCETSKNPLPALVLRYINTIYGPATGCTCVHIHEPFTLHVFLSVIVGIARAGETTGESLASDQTTICDPLISCLTFMCTSLYSNGDSLILSPPLQLTEQLETSEKHKVGYLSCTQR